MRIIIILLSGFLYSISAFSNCNELLIKSADEYIMALEVEKLFKYQEAPCVLQLNAIKNCSRKEKEKLFKLLKLDETFGNICQPYILN